MKASKSLGMFGCAVVAALLAAPITLAAQPEAKPQPAPASATGGHKAGEMDEKAMMEMMMKLAEPGAEHKEMGKLAGNRKLEVTSWPAPGAPPQKSDATAEFKPLMGGRYMQQEVHGSMGGMTFEGMGLEGYDNVTKERWGTWIDSMSTGAMTTRGKCAATAKTCTLTGQMADPMTGKNMNVKEVMTMIDDDHFTFAMHGPGPDGKEFKMMEIAYTRQ